MGGRNLRPESAYVSVVVVPLGGAPGSGRRLGSPRPTPPRATTTGAHVISVEETTLRAGPIFSSWRSCRLQRPEDGGGGGPISLSSSAPIEEGSLFS